MCVVLIRNGDGFINRESYMKKNKLPPEEIAICRRLAEIRKIFEYTLDEIAQKIGIGRERLASYEYGRAPLRADVALLLCRELNINEEWLAKGEGFFQPSIFSDLGALVNSIKPGMLFNDAFNNVLNAELKQRLQRLNKNVDETGWVYLPESDRIGEAKKMIRFLAESWIYQIPPEHLEDFINQLWRTSIDFERKREIHYKGMKMDQILSVRKRLKS